MQTQEVRRRKFGWTMQATQASAQWSPVQHQNNLESNQANNCPCTQRNPRNHMQLTHEQKPTKATYPTEVIFNHIMMDLEDFNPFLVSSRGGSESNTPESH